MLRTMLAATAAAVTLAMAAEGAAAQAVPGAAAVDEYHERFAVDSNPYERSPHTGAIVEEALTGAMQAPDTFVIEESVVLSPVPAAIPERALAAEPGPAAGLTPGAPLGSSEFTDRKVVAGEALR